MQPPLSDVEIRVLGALIEKEQTTPDNYPLSLNALTAACNQSSNREPVMSLDEITVSAAVDSLRKRSLVRAHIQSGGRVTKYGQLAGETLGLVRRQLAVLDVLMLRGPQTTGELRTRTQRLYDFADVEEIESTIEGLMDHVPPFATRLPRRPGQREERFAQLLGGPIDMDALAALDTEREVPERASAATSGERVAALEEAVAQLRAEVSGLRAELAEFRKQFE